MPVYDVFCKLPCKEVKDLVAGLGHQDADTDFGDDQAAVDGRQEPDVVA